MSLKRRTMRLDVRCGLTSQFQVRKLDKELKSLDSLKYQLYSPVWNNLVLCIRRILLYQPFQDE